MSYVATKSRYHIALDGIGLILQGAPGLSSYQMRQAPLYNTRFGEGDRSYSDFSFWWFWAQTSAAGGYKQEIRWADDGMILESEGVSLTDKPGSVLLNWKQTFTAGRAKDVLWYDYGTVGIDFCVMGRNVTDQKMLVMTYDGTIMFEDSTTGANEAVQCSETLTGETLYLGCKTVGSGSSMLKSINSGVTSDVGTHSAGGGIYSLVPYPDGDGLFFFTLSSGLYFYDRGAASITQKKSAYPHGLTGTRFSFCALNGKNAWRIGDKIYFTLQESGGWTSQLWCYDITEDAWVHVYTWGAGFNPARGIARDGNLYLFDKNNNTGRVQIWKYIPATGVMGMLHEIGRYGQTTDLVANIVKDAEYIYFVIDDGSSDYQIWQLDNVDHVFSGITPPSQFAAAANILGMSNNGNLGIAKGGASGTERFDSYAIKPQTARQTTGYFSTSVFDAEIPAIDKLFYDVTINFDTLVSGQGIEVFYSTNNGSSFTSLGTATYTTDGAINTKTFLFGTNIVSKTMVLKFVLTGGGTNTPSFNDYSVRYLPSPTYTKQWAINVNCADEMKTLDGALTDVTARELKGRLERAWWTKSVLDYQDVDYATTLLNGSLDNSSSTITVDNTDDFPEQGRLRVDNEEIIYTGKTRTTFTGCIRGSRETKAVAHSDNAVINNAYKVIITNLEYRIPVALRDKHLEYIVGLSLREA